MRAEDTSCSETGAIFRVISPFGGGERHRKDARSDLFKEVKRNEVLKHEGQSVVRTTMRHD